MPRAIPKAAFLIVGIVTPATASPENVAFPAGYKAHVLYASIDRPDNKTVRDLYASPEAAPLAALGRPLPDGTILTMEGYKDEVDEKGEPKRDGNGRMIRMAELASSSWRSGGAGDPNIPRRSETANGNTRALRQVASSSLGSTPSRVSSAINPRAAKTLCFLSRNWPSPGN